MNVDSLGSTSPESLEGLFKQQQQAARQAPHPTLQERLERLQRLEALIKDHQISLIQSVCEDFGHRPSDETLLAEIMPLQDALKHTRRHLAQWMKPERRRVSWIFQPARARVHHQPLGCVGILSPWNYPLLLSLSPLIGALAAGNRVLLKGSELTPKTQETLGKLLAQYFDPCEVALVTGDATLAAHFASLPWDHLFFTGSTRVGRAVMGAAAKNLTPVTLELGGKSPALIGSNTSIEAAAERILFGKAFNAGQTCVAPDYVLVLESQQQALVEALRSGFAKCYPQALSNRDYCSLANEAQRIRLQSLLDEAQKRGARLVSLDDNPSPTELPRRMVPQLLLELPLDARVLEEEIFGPLLPIIPYRHFEEAVDFIQQREAPLVLYYFGNQLSEKQTLLNSTRSGALVVNETMTHVAQSDLPFGGVGASGMGRYHSIEGFRSFSCARAVFEKGVFNTGTLFTAPYNRLRHKILYRVKGCQKESL